MCAQFAELQTELRSVVSTTTDMFNSITVDSQTGRVESIDLGDTWDKMHSESSAVSINVYKFRETHTFVVCLSSC